MKRYKNDEIPHDEKDMLKDIKRNPKKYNKSCMEKCTKNCKQLAFAKVIRCPSRIKPLATD